MGVDQMHLVEIARRRTLGGLFYQASSRFAVVGETLRSLNCVQFPLLPISSSPSHSTFGQTEH
jgi:hypothetical protein